MGQIKNIKLHIVTDIKCRINQTKPTNPLNQPPTSINMILYKDIFTSFDVFTDVYKMELVDDLYYKVYGKYIEEDNSVDDAVFGGNKSAEAEDDDGEEDNKVLVPDVVVASKLQQVPTMVSKNDYKTYIKGYVAKLIKKVGAEDADRAAFLKANINEKFVMPMLKDFKLLRFYACDGDEYDLEGGIVYMKQDKPDGEEVKDTPITCFILKDALFEEKC